jgi:hypothetical protein
MVMDADEVAAIERSGRSTWQEYAMTPAVYAEHGRPWEVMNDRPGQTAEAQRVEQVPSKRWKPFEDSTMGIIHCSAFTGTLCGLSRIQGILGQQDFFAATGHYRVCPKCAEEYRAMIGSAGGWARLQGMVLARWWPYPSMRHKITKALGRSYKACQTRYRERYQ